MKPVLILIAIAMLTSARLGAQQDDRVGIGRWPSSSESAGIATMRESRSTAMRATGGSELHTWIGLGASIGAIAGATYSIVTVVHASHEDGSIAVVASPFVVEIGIITGMLGGGALGAVAYAITHPSSVRHVT